MGFMYEVMDHNVVILSSKMHEVAEGLRAYNNRLIEKYGPKASEIDETRDMSPLAQVAEKNRWSVSSKPDDDGNLELVSPFGETKGEDYCDWLSAIAVGVKDDSFVTCTNDDDDLYRYVFRNGKMYCIKPTWILSDDAEEY
jgi:hypothetical protein